MRLEEGWYTAGCAHAGGEDYGTVVVAQRNQDGDVLVGMDAEAGATLNVEYEDILPQVAWVEVREGLRSRDREAR